MLLFAVVFVAGWLFSTPGDARCDGPGGAGVPVIVSRVFAWFWAKGQTLAMKTWGIRVVDRDGRPITQRRALLRYFWSWLWFLPPLAALAPLKLRGPEIAVLWLGWVAVWALLSRFHPQRQFWHDALAGTRLVSAPTRGR
jgi:uncharacterized RDD family membrane protein YckC